MIADRTLDVPRSLVPAALTLAIWLTYPFIRLNNLLVIALGIYCLVIGWPYRRIEIRRDLDFFFPIALCLAYMIGILWADEHREAWKQIEKRLALIAFAFIFFVARRALSHYQIRSMLLAFVTACVSIILFCLSNAVFNIIKYQSFRLVEFKERPYYYFAYLPLTQPAAIDPIYLSLYINFSIVIVITLITSKRLKISLLMFLIGANILVASKIGLLVMLMMLFISAVVRIRSRTLTLVLCSCLFAVSILILKYSNFLKERIFVDTRFEFANPYSGNWNSTSQRLAIWTCAMQAMEAKFPLGYGTSDGQKALHAAYVKNNYIRGFEDNYNAHNEYVSTSLDLGVIGLAILLAMLIISFFRALRAGNAAFAYFIVICAAYFLVEVVTSRRAGVNFFAFFYGLLAILNIGTKKTGVHARPHYFNRFIQE